LIFNLDHQVQTVEPVGPQIISEVRLIRNAFDVDTPDGWQLIWIK
jgi:hypothetical protein